jgi:hypothetical protein
LLNKHPSNACFSLTHPLLILGTHPLLPNVRQATTETTLRIEEERRTGVGE